MDEQARTVLAVNPARDYPCRVARVKDGDTFEGWLDRGGGLLEHVIIRVRDLKCPESWEPGGAEATAAAQAWLAEHDDDEGWVRVRSYVAGRVPYRPLVPEAMSFERLVADVFDDETGASMAADLVAAGYGTRGIVGVTNALPAHETSAPSQGSR